MIHHRPAANATITGQTEAVAAFVSRLIPGCDRGFGPCQAIGFTGDHGELVAGVVYHNWSPEHGTIELSAASTRRNWTTRDRIKTVFGYPFDVVGCRIAIARISEHNTRARRIWRSLGASEYTIPKLRTPQEAEVIYTLDADDWRKSKFAR
jgi:RimJ/RimL family protein N-acetyltransferase